MKEFNNGEGIFMFVVDRIEEGLAVIYDKEGKHFNVDADKIKGSVCDGAVVCNNNGVWCVDEEETQKRQSRAKARLDRLFKL